jgi:hypothetical protein
MMAAGPLFPRGPVLSLQFGKITCTSFFSQTPEKFVLTLMLLSRWSRRSLRRRALRTTQRRNEGGI